MDTFWKSRGVSPSAVTSLAGGDINQVFRHENSVYKINNRSDFPQMFIREAQGLQALSTAFSVPNMLDVGEFEDLQFLELQFIEEGNKTEDFWMSFGHDLSKLHQTTQSTYGFSDDNYIGSLRQSNIKHDSWMDFLVQERLDPMIQMAVNSGEVNYVEAKGIEHFYQRIEEIYPNEKPALLHGDLWAGNFLCQADGNAALIDPAVYYGHREIDLGMMHLFGGFNEPLFEVYNDLTPLEKNWKSRIKINQLYPLLVHVNLFGRSYWSQIEQILGPFKK